MRLCIILSLIFLLVGLGANPVLAQGKLGKVGKIFSVEEANTLFGEVTAQKTINTKFLKRILKKSERYVRIKLAGKYLSIFEDTKNMEDIRTRFKESALTVNNKPEHIFSNETITELLELGGSEATIIEMRGDVLTVTNGPFTLEFGTLCPPICP